MSTRRYGPYSVETSKEDKALFPKSSITKGDLIDYYERVSEYVLPHLSERPLVLQRFPDGIEEDGFYQKQASDYFPDWIDTTNGGALRAGRRLVKRLASVVEHGRG